MLALARHRIVIARPVEAVWSALADLERMPEWFPGVLSVRALDALEPGTTGKRYAERVRLPLRGAVDATLELLESAPPAKLAFATGRPPLRPRFDFELRRLSPEETALQWSCRARAHGLLARTAAPLARATLERRAPHALACLRQRLETGCPTLRAEPGDAADAVPTAGPHDVLVRLSACRPDLRPGREGAGGCSGVVAARGGAVRYLRVGEAVFGSCGPRAEDWAEWATLPAAWLAPRPAALSHVDAAWLAGPGLTAWALLEAAGLAAARPEGWKVLVNLPLADGGAQAIQLLAERGARATCVASGESETRARALGVDTTPRLEEAPRGVFDAVLDARGAAPEALLATLARDARGRCAQLAPERAPGAPAARARTTLEAGWRRMQHGARLRRIPLAPDGEALRCLAEHVESAGLRPDTLREIPLDASAALAPDEQQAISHGNAVGTF